VLAIADEWEQPDLACQALELLGRHRRLVAMDLRAAESYLRNALLRARRARLVAWEIRTLLQLAYVDIGRLNGPSRIEQARNLAESSGVLALCADLDHLLATAHLTSHALDLADHAAERALRQAQRYRLTELSAVAQGIRATMLGVQGRRMQSEAMVADALRRTSDPHLQASIRGSALVLAALAVNDLRAAARQVDTVRRGLAASQVLVQPPFLGMFFGMAAVVRALEGRSLEQGRDWIEMDNVFMHGSFQIARAIEAGRSGDTATAVELFAAGDHQLTRAPWVQALYRRYAAEAAADDGWGDPDEWLAAAESFFVASGSTDLAAACQGLRTGAPWTDWGLTPREHDVLELVVEGHTNKEIAARLYLSTRTVEKHVERLLMKSAQPNRTSLSRHASLRTSSPRHLP
jgi:DNA-binding CsgD family transcriptional regulator